MGVLLAIAASSSSTNLAASPIYTDLWDSSQAGFVGPVSLGGGGSFCGSFLNIFGGSVSCGSAPDSFAALGYSGLSLRWNTSLVTVGSFALYSPSNFLGSEVNEIIGIRLYTLDSNNQNPVLFYDSGTISHNPANDGTTALLAVTLTTPVTSANWRMDIIDQRSAGGDAPIYRIIELDGFAPESSAIPEPSAIVLVAAGLAGLGLLRGRRRGGRP